MRKMICIIFVIISFLLVSCDNKLKFEGFITISSTGSIYHERVKPQSVLNDCVSVKVIVTGYDEEVYTVKDYPRLIFYFQITDTFGEEDIDTSPTYSIWVMGSFKKQFYRQPLPQVGKEYVLFNFNTFFTVENTQPSTYWLKVVNDEGEEYLYSSYLDISALPSSIKITDENENKIYKKGEHNSILRYLKSKNIPNPTYDYKIKIPDFVNEVRVIINGTGEE